jgi:hypothetical protein
MVTFHEVKDSHIYKRTFSNEQIKESIIEGSRYAGWETQDQGNNNILATYRIRVHIVTVNIYYTEIEFTALYKSSTLMKMACTQRDYYNRWYLESGKSNCVGNRRPVYIQKNYKVWVESLVASIKSSLETR